MSNEYIECKIINGRLVARPFSAVVSICEQLLA